MSLPGAVVLAGIAALRAGAGKLQIATCRTIAPHVGVAVPESLSLGLDETFQGTISPSSAAKLQPRAARADAVLIGPGMQERDSNSRFVSSLLRECVDACVILDAGALAALTKDPEALRNFDGNAVITPHAGEMASLLGVETGHIAADPVGGAKEAARLFGAVVILKGSRTLIATPAGKLFRYESGDVGLATSGSGDALAGVVAGLAARGAPPLHAAIWAVFLHGAAGNALKRRSGRIGYLARELLDEIPAVMNAF